MHHLSLLLLTMTKSHSSTCDIVPMLIELHWFQKLNRFRKLLIPQMTKKNNSLLIVRYENINVDLKSKPQWFLDLNPLGKVPTVIVSTYFFNTLYFTIHIKIPELHFRLERMSSMKVYQFANILMIYILAGRLAPTSQKKKLHKLCF